MRFFLDTANIDEIKKAASWGVVAGVTTNPTLVRREGKIDFHDRIREIASVVEGPVSAEVVSMDREGMVREALVLSAIAPNVVVKIPMCQEGMAAVKELSSRGIPTNVTLIFSPQQALLAAVAGATYVSPFVGRLDDIGEDGIELVKSIATLYAIHDIQAKIIAASIRNNLHVFAAALAGADFATIPFNVLEGLFSHSLTDKGIARFLADWEAYRKQ